MGDTFPHYRPRRPWKERGVLVQIKSYKIGLILGWEFLVVLGKFGQVYFWASFGKSIFGQFLRPSFLWVSNNRFSGWARTRYYMLLISHILFQLQTTLRENCQQGQINGNQNKMTTALTCHHVGKFLCKIFFRNELPIALLRYIEF